MPVTTTIKNIHGEYKPIDLFRYFDDGIRKRLPKNLASSFREEIINNIDTNAFGFQLSPRWVEYKTKMGGDSRPFIMFGHYKDAISVITSEGHLSVGFKRSAMHPRAKISMGRLAVRLEYGDLGRGIPARPLWRNTATNFFRNKRKVGDHVKEAIENKNKFL